MATVHFFRSDFSSSGHTYGHCPLLPIGKIIEWPYIWPLPPFAAQGNFQYGHCQLLPRKEIFNMATVNFCRSAKSSSDHIYGHSQLYRVTSGKYEICMSASGYGSGCLPHYTIIPFRSFINKNRRQDGWITSVQPAVV
jgi:hypothetical protein